MERYIQRTLKNWAAKHNPPESLRGRVILIAAAQSHPLEEPALTHRLREYTHSARFYDLETRDPAKVFDLVWAFQLPIPAIRHV